MNTKSSNIALLPTGFVDLMPEEAEKEACAIQTLMDLFSGYGYRRIKPPLLEFEDSLLAPGPGMALASDTFRLMDPVSHRMMGLRADITPQIARIVCTRLKNSDAPIRLTYANDVLRTKAGQMRTSRQFCQVGCEIIHDESISSYVEALMLIVLGLKALGLKDITIDLTIPRLLDNVIDGFDLNVERDHDLRQALNKRDADQVRGFGDDRYDVLIDLLSCIGDAENSLMRAKEISIPEIALAEILKLITVVSDLKSALDSLGISDVNLTFDPFETKGFEYQGGIAFTVFANDIRAELGRGGYYDVRFGEPNDDKSEKAIGFTLFMDTIRPEVKFDVGEECLGVRNDTDWSVQEAFRKEGWAILRYSDGENIPKICTHVLDNNKPKKR